MKKIQYKAASIIWKSDVIPFSNQFQDPYFSADGGLAESQYVFIKGNDLYDRLIDGFKIAELGFGTGLNLLSLIRLWASLGRPGKLNFTSFEAFPIKPADMRRALKNFPDLINLSNYLCDILERGATHFEIGNINVQLIYGDARETIITWDDIVDAWFLDGFAPIKNPELWGYELLRSVANKTIIGGTFSTYSAAGAVRRNLTKLGFEVTKTKGFGNKRHMLLGKKIGQE